MTDQQLQLALAETLSEKMWVHEKGFFWRWNKESTFVPVKSSPNPSWNPVLDTEWLHVCHLVEQTLDERDKAKWLNALSKSCYKENDSTAMIDLTFNLARSTWQQRAEALCKVKGITP